MIGVQIHEDAWLSSIFGHGVFRIETLSAEIPQEASRPAFCDIIRRHASGQAAAMYYAKVETRDVELVRTLGLAGFYAVDVNVTFSLHKTSPFKAADHGMVSIAEVSPDHHQHVLNIAESCFQYSRFHLDPQVSRSIADRIKRDWILSYITKRRGDRLMVALMDGQPAGFLAALTSNSCGKPIATIDLIGVSRSLQNHGVGQALITFFVNQYRDRYERLEVGTQVANFPSMRLYQKLGFSIIRSAYVMHMHTRNGRSST